MAKGKGLIFRRLQAFIVDKVQEAGGLEVPGPEKFAHVKQAAIEWLDEAIKPKNPLLEIASDAAIHAGVFLIEGMIQVAVEDGREAGLLK